MFTEAFKFLVVISASSIVLGQIWVDGLGSRSAGGHSVESSQNGMLDVVNRIRFSDLSPMDGRYRVALWVIMGCEYQLSRLLWF